MWNCCYNIIMQTSIGARYGTMSVTVDNSKIDGMMNILKKANPFSGTIDDKGDCQIHGEITTLMRTIPYEAAGRITKGGLHLKIEGEQECFDVSGTVLTEEKEPGI